jgi:outer membrane protein assembly factor BamD (BamD/ComL family)
MGQKRAGDLSGADATLETLLRDHPGGPLAESALVERMRIVSRMDRARGKDLAAVYLRRHPQGAARVEAERLIAGEP